jgi:hypothetical protein
MVDAYGTNLKFFVFYLQADPLLNTFYFIRIKSISFLYMHLIH